MRARSTWIWAICLLAGPAGAQVAESTGPGQNVLTRYLDWADIHPAAQVGRLAVFPITLNRSDRLEGVLSMQQALARGLLAVEELGSARVAEARFINKSGREMIFLMAGELITGGKQNRTLRTDALLAPDSSVVLPLYCVQKGRWEGGKRFDAAPTAAPQGVRERAAAGAGQDAVWAEVARANERMKSATTSEDLAEAMAKPENARKLAGLREQIAPKLPRGCVGLVAAVDGRIVAADLFNSPDLFAALRDKVLDSYLSEYGWTLPVRHLEKSSLGTVSAREVQAYLRGCYNSRVARGELRGVGRVYYIRGERSGQTLGTEDGKMVHTALMGREILPVRPEPRPAPLPRPLPRR